MNKNENKCPVCGCKKHVYIDVSDPGGNAGLIIARIGAVYPCVCLECGNVYVDKYDVNKLREAYNVKKENQTTE